MLSIMSISCYAMLLLAEYIGYYVITSSFLLSLRVYAISTVVCCRGLSMMLKSNEDIHKKTVPKSKGMNYERASGTLRLFRASTPKILRFNNAKFKCLYI